MNFNYLIKDCKYFNCGIFNLGVKVDCGIRDFKIKYVENVVLVDLNFCKDYFF